MQYYSSIKRNKTLKHMRYFKRTVGNGKKVDLIRRKKFLEKTFGMAVKWCLGHLSFFHPLAIVGHLNLKIQST